MSDATRAVPPSVNSWSAEYLDAEYARYLTDPGSVPADLRSFFQGFDLALARPAGMAPASGGGPDAAAMRLQSAVADLIEAYRSIGHIASKLDPFGRAPQRPKALSLEYHGLSEQDLDRPVNHGTLPLPPETTLREIVAFLEDTYCSSIGLQSAHMSNSDERTWLLQRFERDRGRIPLSRGDKAHILERIVRAEQFEKFLQKRYPGDKRFSLEGGESLIPLMDRTIDAASELGIEEMVLGMPHRGRLNVLNNVLGKSYEQIFTEFEDTWEDEEGGGGGGDVKYHRGYSGDRALRNGKTIRLAMASNPSHLESVNGVVMGRCRGKQRLRGDEDRSRVMPMLLHGDAAFIGQGPVAEALNLSGLEGYTVGGTIHVVVNNLIGFTTGPEDARSTRYCTDIALMLETPIFHVNGDDPEACVCCAQIAVEYRQKFKKDPIIDMYCFRRYGHNEQDEASFTQPVLTSLIKAHPGVLATYSRALLAEGVLNESDMETIRLRLEDALEQAQKAAKQKPYDPTIDPGSKRWSGFGGRYSFDPAPTAVPMARLAQVCEALGRVPEGFNLNPKLKQLLADRAALPQTGQISYADAESLAFGTLLLEGHDVRLSGQDCRRGTFSHRHAVLRDSDNERRYVPLNNIIPQADGLDGLPGGGDGTGQARLHVYDSPLSEAAVLAFDYGYSLSSPNILVMWEAQFGDFANGAQVIIDQYLASAEMKWERWSGLTLLLPHGYEGAGPEHSSCRIERFLQLCGNDNMQVCYPSTAAQAFHMLRRQVKSSFRKPLIVATPKSMLRVPTSSIEELTKGTFEHLLDDPMFSGGRDRSAVKRVLFCSGKFYHEMAARREAIGRTDTAIVRVEQFYPFNASQARSILAKYPASASISWAQEEPRNAGGYLYMTDVFRTALERDLGYIGRPTSSSPATGSKHHHKDQQEALLSQAIGPLAKPAPSANGSHAPAASGKPAPKPKAKAKA